MTVYGPGTSPFGPLTDRTWDETWVTESARKEAGSMSRSNVTSIALTVAFTTRLLPVTAAPGTCELATCGPGTISGSVLGSKGATNGVLLTGSGIE